MSLKKKLIVAAAAALVLAAGTAFLLRPVEIAEQLTYAHESLTGFHSATVTVEGLPLHYLVTGPENGQPVVLVHGLGGSAEDWLNLAPYLTRAGYRVYMPDLVGYGRSPRPASFSYSVPDESAVVIGFMDAMHLKQVELGGWSMGGWIVQLAAIAFPERVHRLMIFDSVGLYAPPTWNTSLFTPTNPEELAEMQALLMPHPPTLPGFVARDVLRVSRQRAWVIHRALNSMLTGHDITDALLPTLKMPVLLVWGSVDAITPLALGQQMHQLLPQSEFVVASGCGHLAPTQCTGVLGPQVAGFLVR